MRRGFVVFVRHFALGLSFRWKRPRALALSESIDGLLLPSIHLVRQRVVCAPKRACFSFPTFFRTFGGRKDLKDAS
jgi:hypothetical protein